MYTQLLMGSYQKRYSIKINDAPLVSFYKHHCDFSSLTLTNALFSSNEQCFYRSKTLMPVF